MSQLNYIAEKIRNLMEKKGMSYRKLARKTGLAQKTIYLTLTEPEDRTVKTLHKIAKVLDVPLYALFVPDNLPDWKPEEETALHRYLCPKCNRTFAAGTSVRYCPYCGATF